MDASHESRLEHLEMLYSEQDLTVQSLNDTVARQEIEIAGLRHHFAVLQMQLQSLREGLGDPVSQEFEKPPHY